MTKGFEVECPECHAAVMMKWVGPTEARFGRLRYHPMESGCQNTRPSDEDSPNSPIPVEVAAEFERRGSVRAWANARLGEPPSA